MRAKKPLPADWETTILDILKERKMPLKVVEISDILGINPQETTTIYHQLHRLEERGHIRKSDDSRYHLVIATPESIEKPNVHHDETVLPIDGENKTAMTLLPTHDEKDARIAALEWENAQLRTILAWQNTIRETTRRLQEIPPLLPPAEVQAIFSPFEWRLYQECRAALVTLMAQLPTAIPESEAAA